MLINLMQNAIMIVLQYYMIRIGRSLYYMIDENFARWHDQVQQTQNNSFRSEKPKTTFQPK